MFAMSVRHSSLLLLHPHSYAYSSSSSPPPSPPPGAAAAAALVENRSPRSRPRPRLHPWPPWRLCAADGMREVGATASAGAMTALRYESNSVRYGDISGLQDQSEVHVDVQVRGPSMVVFSGGTAFNGVVEELKKLTTRVAHVLPVSDDGGSTAEIVRVLGGPAVGDIRSRCLRLSSDSSMEALAVKRLLGHRLSQEESEAKAEWYEIVEGEHQLWDDVSGPYRETIRAFLVHFQCQILRHSADKFSFRNGSIGNFFFAGARIFFQSLDAAIFLYSRVSHIPTHSSVLPAICTNDRLTLGCELQDGMVIKGQNAISHPTVKNAKCRTSVSKASSPLPSPIKRIFYMSSEGNNIFHEVFPAVNPTVVDQLSLVDAVVYGMGSLYTSICPSLVLRGVGETIAARSCLKVLILNGTHDRETAGMSASQYVCSITDALNRKFCDSVEVQHCDDPCPSLDYAPSDFITVMLVPEGGEIEIDVENLIEMGIVRVVTVESILDEKLGRIFEPKALIEALQVEIAIHQLNSSK